MPTPEATAPLHPTLIELAVAVAIARRHKRQHAATAATTRAPALAGLHQYLLLLLRAVTARRGARGLAPSPGPVPIPVLPPTTTTDTDAAREPDHGNDASLRQPTAADVLQRVLAACRNPANDPVTTVSQLLATINPRSTARDAAPVDPVLIDAWLAASVDLEDRVSSIPADTRAAHETLVAHLVARVDGWIQSDT
ncbi:hypothetical protein GGF32_004288 [Allomyces javanicus]|nr:hypothetical protein GGF32_004288 [Allomyces javanicus]